MRPEPVAAESTTPDEARIKALRELVPEAFREGQLDGQRLLETLGLLKTEPHERYHFSWVGRREAIEGLRTPTRATLTPSRAASRAYDETHNALVIGDNLEILKLLYKPYFNRIKLVYIDPPYNTGNDFIYPDDYAEPLENYLRLTGQRDHRGNYLVSNPETDGRYHSKWLSMMYPRLFLARQLLTDDGLIFISIDDHELANLRIIMNEIFGEENFLACIAWEKRYTRSNNAKLFYSLKDSIVVYRKTPAVEFLRESRTEKANSIYGNPDNDPRGPWTSSSYVNPATKEERPNLVYKIENPFNREEIEHETHAWKYSHEEHKRHLAENRLWWGKDKDAKYPRLKVYLSENAQGLVPIDLWDYKTSGTTDEGGQELKDLFGAEVFDNPKPTKLIKRILRLVTSSDENAIVLDFFAGSGTTGQAVLELNEEDGGNRRFILVQLPEPTAETSTARKQGFETIADVTRARLNKVCERINASRKSTLEQRSPSNVPGFRVFTLEKSHYVPWTPGAKPTTQTLLTELDKTIDRLIPGWTPDGVAAEILLKEGLTLTSRTKRVSQVKSNQLMLAEDEFGRQVYYCLDDKISHESIRAANLTAEDVLVCRDSAMNDKTAANLALQCRLKSI